MFLVYQPEGSDEPQRWRYHPQKLMSAEREMLERRTGRDYSDFTKAVVSGNSGARRALLFMFLKRDHPGTRYEDVDFAWDELTLQYSKGEYLKMREDAQENLAGEQLTMALQQIDAEIEKAYDDADAEGKAQRPIAE